MIYSWFTTNTPYADLAPILAGDCQRLGLAHEIIPVPALNSWDQATSFKSKVVLSILERETRPFWFVDVDSRIQSAPQDPDTDFAAHWLRDEELQGSVLWFKPGATVQALVQAWDARNVAMAGIRGDQLNLMDVVAEASGLTITRLSPAHCWIDDISQRYYPQPSPIVFYQCQASRQFKDRVTKPGFRNTCKVYL
jgi:hypothetical protein